MELFNNIIRAWEISMAAHKILKIPKYLTKVNIQKFGTVDFK